MLKRSLASLALAASLAVAAVPAAPALADGAASTRNIIGGAAIIGGTLLIINHNKKVHQREDEMSRRQAAAEESANNYQAAYQSEKRAYAHQVAINAEYKREVALQHRMIVSMRQQAKQRTALVSPSGNVPARNVATTSYGWGAR